MEKQPNGSQPWLAHWCHLKSITILGPQCFDMIGLGYVAATEGVAGVRNFLGDSNMQPGLRTLLGVVQHVLLTIRLTKGWREADLTEITIAPVIKELLWAESIISNPHHIILP